MFLLPVVSFSSFLIPFYISTPHARRKRRSETLTRGRRDDSRCLGTLLPTHCHLLACTLTAPRINRLRRFFTRSTPAWRLASWYRAQSQHLQVRALRPSTSSMHAQCVATPSPMFTRAIMRQSKAFRMASIPRIAWSRTSTLRAAAMSSAAVTLRAVVSPEQPSSSSHILTLIAPPFHPEGQRPSAPCPTCIKEKNDSSPRDLFSIRGFQKDEYDPVIPSTWFVSPPNFNEIGKDIEALKVCKS